MNKKSKQTPKKTTTRNSVKTSTPSNTKQNPDKLKPRAKKFKSETDKTDHRPRKFKSESAAGSVRKDATLSLKAKKFVEEPIRIQKLLAELGFASRRKIEAMIAEGRIKVNGKLATLGMSITRQANVMIDEKSIQLAEVAEKRVVTQVLLYHKPVGVVCTRDDPEGRETVFEHLPKLKNQRWVMVGRLDINTAGLLIFTNDGALANHLMHPKHEVLRMYAVRVLGSLTEQMIATLKNGVCFEDGILHAESIRDAGGQGVNHWYHVGLREGKNREIRRLFESQGLQVSRLIRIQFETFTLQRSLRPGRYEMLNPSQVRQLLARLDL